MEYVIQINQTDNYVHGIRILHQNQVLIPMHYAVERALSALS